MAGPRPLPPISWGLLWAVGSETLLKSTQGSRFAQKTVNVSRVQLAIGIRAQISQGQGSIC